MYSKTNTDNPFPFGVHGAIAGVPAAPDPIILYSFPIPLTPVGGFSIQARRAGLDNQGNRTRPTGKPERRP